MNNFIKLFLPADHHNRQSERNQFLHRKFGDASQCNDESKQQERESLSVIKNIENEQPFYCENHCDRSAEFSASSSSNELGERSFRPSSNVATASVSWADSVYDHCLAADSCTKPSHV